MPKRSAGRGIVRGQNIKHARAYGLGLPYGRS